MLSPPTYTPYDVALEAVPPSYSNSITLTALLTRKMEFTSTSVVAKDRSWKSVWCSIDGTSLTIYKDTRALPARLRSSTSPRRSSCPLPMPLDITELGYASYIRRQSVSSPPSAKAPTAAVSTVAPHRPAITSPHPDDAAKHLKRSDILRQYTLQGACCGLATGYQNEKRPHVIRLRVENEQFLLQLPNLQSVLQWIETIQTAVGVSLDLDERPMPKGHPYPRHPADHQ